MKKKYELWPFNFGALRKQNFNAAMIAILPVPYEGTVSFNVGTSNGPYAIINSSRYLDELFDNEKPGQAIGLRTTDIFTLDEIELTSNSVYEALQGLRQAIETEVLHFNKIPIMLGGEHSITLAAVWALKKKYPDLSVLHFDAHTDLLDSYEGSRYSHACTMRRVRDLKVPVVSIGIRNTNTHIEDYIKRHKIKNIFHAPHLPSIKQVMKGLRKHVYLTFDLDCLDPSIMPSVGTPEPGGLGWYEVVDIIERIAQKTHIIGADVVELMPIPGLEAPSFLAAKLTYSIIRSAMVSNRAHT